MRRRSGRSDRALKGKPQRWALADRSIGASCLNALVQTYGAVRDSRSISAGHSTLGTKRQKMLK